jgi:molybdopterin-containing oxidoreductase family iron-sulfur binding subunit
MNLADIRARLQGLEGRAYWRSLEELADTSDFQQYVHREFPSQASEFNDPAGRRQFLKLMGASLALAGVSACTRQPAEKIVPYVRQPEEIVPGRPLFYATAMPLGGVGMPVLAENHMGRPTKLEGNPEHPASLGATDVLTQASVLSLYDPDRSRTVLNRGEVRTWGGLVAALQSALGTQAGSEGAGFRLLTPPVTSPSLVDQIQALLAKLPQAKWHQWDAVYGTVQGGAPAAAALYHFDKADVVVALDADFLGFGPASVRYSKDFSSRRRMGTPSDALNRLYAVEPAPTVTGASADHRLALKARDVHAFAAALAAAIGAGGAASAGELPDEARTKWIPAIADDLRARRGRSVVVAGDQQPAAVHALARAMNDALGNTGTTVVYTTPIVASPADGVASLAELVGDMNAGLVSLLVIVDSNPVFTAPADLEFATAFQKVAQRVHLGLYYDETAALSHWHAPEAHYLESWGDLRAFDGTVSLVQPLIAPLYNGHTALELVAAMNAASGTPMELVRAYWTRAFSGQTTATWTLADRDGRPFADVDTFWRHALHDGFIASTSMLAGAAIPAAPPAAPAPAAPGTPTGLEIVFRPDPYILDGRNANNGWLQELPRPISKLTWDNVAYVSPRTADRMGIAVTRPGNQDNDVIEIKYQGRSLHMPVWVMPGTADDVVVVFFGYGSERAGRVGSKLGHNAFGLRMSKTPWFDGGAEITKTGESYLVVSTQNHFAMEGRHPVRVVDAAEYKANPKAVEEIGPERPADTATLYPTTSEHPFNQGAQHRWAMAIDLNACTGCSACVIACVAENNIPVVGKAQVYRNREMHWIRVDTYFDGDPAAPTATHSQPVPCQQCENAPCEVVCPVAATVHSDEGLNDMVYNRCVGTRYCSNNCPYKVRRFNFLLYSDFTTPELMAQRNPDVTIRSRGVMEKCNYCVQRINYARVDSKVQDHPIADGDVKTACQQVCPADAIVFGDLNDATSKVVALKRQERNYGLLQDLGTRPRTTYLAKVRNPNPALA